MLGWVPRATITLRSQAIAEAAVAVTVTDVGDAPSLTLDGFADRVTAGSCSSSVSDIDVAPVWTILPSALCTPWIVMVSVCSTRLSSTGVRMNVPVPVVEFAGTLTSKKGTRAKSVTGVAVSDSFPAATTTSRL